MTSPENIIVKLRPASGSAVDLAAALTRADAAAAEQEVAVTRAKAARDDALLDADPATLRKAEATLAIEREQSERLGAVVSNLTARHKAAVENEALQLCADLKTQTEAAEAAQSVWWQGARVQLVAMFTEGLKLTSVASNLRFDHERARLDATSKYPSAELPYPVGQTIDAGHWTFDLSRTLGFLHGGSRDTLEDVKSILTIGDPQPLPEVLRGPENPPPVPNTGGFGDPGL